MSQQELINLITNDFLSFTLSYTSQSSEFCFSVNACRVVLHCDGILSFTPHDWDVSKKSILLSCAVHGNETAPIEICNDLINDLLNGRIVSAHRVMFIFGNIPSMHSETRFVEENLNRLFVKDLRSNTMEGQRALQIMNCVDDFFDAHETTNRDDKLHYDLHTAIRPSKNEKFAVYPFLHGKAHSKKQIAFLNHWGVNSILLSQSPTGTFSYYSSYFHNAHSFTVELGKVMPFGQNDRHKFKDVKSNLQKLISDTEILESDAYHFDRSKSLIYKVNQVINKTQDDFKLHFSDDIANFTEFAKGDMFASETGVVYLAEHDREAIVFPNADVEIGQRALLTVVPHEL